MPTADLCQLVGIPERSYKAHAGHPPKGPWPAPIRVAHRQVTVALAIRHPAWGHRKILVTARHGCYRVLQSSVLRILDDAGLLLKTDYQREPHQLAQARKAAFAAAPTGPNMVWQFDFSEYETTGGGTWRVGGIADYWSKYEFGWHWSPTANQHEAIAAVELALAEAQRLLDGPTLVEHLTDPARHRRDRPDHPGHRQRRTLPLVAVSARSSPVAPSFATSAPESERPGRTACASARSSR